MIKDTIPTQFWGVGWRGEEKSNAHVSGLRKLFVPALLYHQLQALSLIMKQEHEYGPTSEGCWAESSLKSESAI